MLEEKTTATYTYGKEETDRAKYYLLRIINCMEPSKIIALYHFAETLQRAS